MTRTQVKGTQILDNDLTTDDIKDHTIVRADINTSSSTGLITDLQTSTGLKQTYTGSFSGTGTVTIALDEEVTGLTITGHRSLDQLVHEIAEDTYCEIGRTDGRVSSVIYYTDSDKSIKIREINYTRTSGRISQIAITHYNSEGNPITGETYTGLITRSEGRIQSISWVLT